MNGAAFRCSVASLARTEHLTGSASTVRAFLLVEAPGPWGVDAVAGSRLPAPVKEHLATIERRHHVRPLMVRPHGRQRLPGTRVFAASTDVHGPWVETTLLDDVTQVLDLPLAQLRRGRSLGLTPYDEPLFCVCTHGRHDACCAELGRPLCRAMHAADPEHTWEVSHIGGDRFAPNVLVLPHGLYYGRVTPEEAASFVASHHEGELVLPRLRGRSGFGFSVQAAEIYLREHLHALGVEAPRLVSAERDRDEWSVVLELQQVAWQVRLRTSRDEPHRLTCRALVPHPGLRHELLGIEQLPPAGSVGLA